MQIWAVNCAALPMSCRVGLRRSGLAVTVPCGLVPCRACAALPMSLAFLDKGCGSGEMRSTTFSMALFSSSTSRAMTSTRPAARGRSSFHPASRPGAGPRDSPRRSGGRPARLARPPQSRHGNNGRHSRAFAGRSGPESVTKIIRSLADHAYRLLHAFLRFRGNRRQAVCLKNPGDARHGV